MVSRIIATLWEFWDDMPPPLRVALIFLLVGVVVISWP